jgi:LPS O-antigen subunit length determinant protein (WzzB/FepE family)
MNMKTGSQESQGGFSDAANQSFNYDNASYYPLGNELDTKALILSLWAQKWMIVLVTALGIIAATLGWYALSDRYKVTLDLFPLPISENSKFVPVNQAARIMNGSARQVSSSTLYSLFIDELRSKRKVIDAVRNSALLNEDDFSNAEAYDLEAQKFAAEIKLDRLEARRNSTSDDDFRNWKLSFNARNEANIRDFLSILTFGIGDDIRKNILAEYDVLIGNLERQFDFEKDDLAIKYSNLIADHKVDIERNLAFLEQDLILAETLGIVDGKQSLEFFDNKTSVIPYSTENGARAEGSFAVVANSPPRYLKGSNAIRKEIELQKTRIDDKQFVSGLLSIDRRLRAIDQDNRIERLRAAIATSPLSDEKFEVVSYYNGAATVKKQFSLILFLFVGAVIGGLIALSIALARYFFRQPMTPAS